MTDINRLTAVDSLSGGDNFPLYDQSNGDARRTSLTTLTSYLQSALSFGAFIPQLTTQYFAPSATGFTATITDGPDSVHLILTPVGDYATGAIVLPSALSAKDKQIILVNCTRSITALTITSVGGTVTGAPTTISAQGYFRLKYDAVTSTWYRAG